MSELEALVGVFAAVDQRVIAQPSLVPALAAIVCPYQYGAAGWSVPFQSWMSANGGRPLPQLDAALRELADSPRAARTSARRLLAVAALSRVTDGLSSPSLRRAAAGALVSPGISPSLSGAEDLVDLLADPATLPDISDWGSMLATAASAGLINRVLAEQTQPPCAAQVLSIPGNPNPVCTLETNLCTTSLTLAEAEAFLDPRNWSGCSSLWCSMTPLPGATPPAQRYLETISLDCADPSLQMHTVLDFSLMVLPNGQGAIVDYRRCPDQSQGGDGLVTVDEGAIEVLQVGNQVCIHTTKRVQFSQGFTAGELAMISCALGYGAVGEELVFACALQSGGTSNYPYQGSPLPGGGGHARGTAPRQTPEPIAVIIGDGVAAVGACLSECAAAAQCAQSKLAAGTYGPADYVSDMSKAATRLFRDLSVATALSARTLKATQASAGRAKAGEAEEAAEQ